MPLSSTTTFTLTRNDLIQATCRATGYLGSGETLSTDDYTNLSQALNIMVKGWAATPGLSLWVTQEITLPLISSLRVYPIGNTAGYVYSISASGGSGYISGGTWTATNGTTGTAASGTYTVAGGVIDVMTILVAGDSYTSAPTTFTLSGPGSSATITATIAGLTTHRPLKILQRGNFIRDANGNDAELIQLSRQEYNVYGVKTTAGKPNSFYYDPQLTNGYIYFYNVLDLSTYTARLQVQRQFFDMVGASDNFDFPQEWFGALKWGLAAEAASELGVRADMIPYFEGKAAAALERCFDFSVEEASTYFTVDMQGR